MDVLIFKNMAKKVEIIVDKEKFSSRKKAMDEFFEGMMACDGSESERYCYAYCMLKEGYNYINTYRELASKTTPVD